MRAIFVILCLILTGCTTLKPYEKEYLLSPIMEDGGVAALNNRTMAAAAADFEKLGGSAGAKTGATSCPTCGG